MIEVGQDHPQYVSSAILSKKIRKYYQDAAELIPFFKENTNFAEVSTDNAVQALQNTMDEIFAIVEPLVIHVRPGANSGDLREQIVSNLSKDHGFINLDIKKCIVGECDRGTDIGKELRRLVANSKIIGADLIVKMLNKIIYCGQENLNKYILTNFPEYIDQAKEFEKNCAKIAALIYPSNNASVVEIKNNALSQFTIDSLFQKDFKLKTMNEWNYQLFDEKMGNKVQFGFMVGKSLSGKSALAKVMADTHGYSVIDMKAITEKIKESKGTEEGPFEGEIPIKEVEDNVMNAVKSGKNQKFVFDDYTHTNEEDFIAFLEKIGVPDFVLFLTAEESAIKERYCKKNEMEEFPED